MPRGPRWLDESKSDDEHAARERSDFLRYVDQAGRYADFHTLRHAFITNVGRTGAHFKTPQDLARHSTPALTARYTHSVQDDQVEAVRALSKLSSLPIGFDGKNSSLYSSDLDASEDQTVQFSAVGASGDSPRDNHRNSGSGNALAIPATTCENTPQRRRDAGVAERGGFENH